MASTEPRKRAKPQPQPTYPTVWSRLHQQLTPEEIRKDMELLHMAGAAAADGDGDAASARLGVSVPLQLTSPAAAPPRPPLQESWLEPPTCGSHEHPAGPAAQREALTWPPPPPPGTPAPAASGASERPQRSHKRPARYAGTEVSQDMIARAEVEERERRQEGQHDREDERLAAAAAAAAAAVAAAGPVPAGHAAGGALPWHRPPSRQADSHSTPASPEKAGLLRPSPAAVGWGGLSQAGQQQQQQQQWRAPQPPWKEEPAAAAWQPGQHTRPAAPTQGRPTPGGWPAQPVSALSRLGWLLRPHVQAQPHAPPQPGTPRAQAQANGGLRDVAGTGGAMYLPAADQQQQPQPQPQQPRLPDQQEERQQQLLLPVQQQQQRQQQLPPLVVADLLAPPPQLSMEQVQAMLRHLLTQTGFPAQPSLPPRHP